MTTVELHYAKKLQELIGKADWRQKLTSGDGISFHFEVSTPTDIESLGRHFGQALTLDNRQSPFNRLTRVGVLGLPGSGKTHLTNGIIMTDENFVTLHQSGDHQLMGRGAEFGYVCRADCGNRGVIEDYAFRERRSKMIPQGLLELVEHAHTDIRPDEGYDVMVLLRGGWNHQEGVRNVEILAERPLVKTKGFQRFIAEAEPFRQHRL